MSNDVAFEWVDEIPEKIFPSPYDEVVEKVLETSQIARIEASQSSLHTLANRLRKRYGQIKVTARTTPEGYFVYLTVPETKAPATTNKKKGDDSK